MAERRTIGQILMSFGRITEADVERALEYQKEHGGYFGEALLGLGLVSQEELEWSLASQFDLPYIFPDPDTIDPDAAALVAPEWALAHLTMPIMRTGDTLTVVVDSPIRTTAVDELAARTDLDIELALAPASQIRELVRQVYARTLRAHANERPTPVPLGEALTLATEVGAPRFGISTRGARSWFWYDDSGTMRRRPLEGRWREELDETMAPSPSGPVEAEARGSLNGHLTRAGIVTPMELRWLSDESGHEFLFRTVEETSILHERFSAPPPGVLSEVRLLSRSGSARFMVSADPAELGHEILPFLPALLLEPGLRAIYINADEQRAAGEAFSLRMPKDPDRWAGELETLRAFRFDVVTVDLSGNAEDWAASALDVAAVAFLLWPEDEERRAAYDAGIRWELNVSRGDGATVDWTLEPLRL